MELKVMFHVFVRWFLVAVWSLLPPCQADRTELVSEENTIRSPNHTSALYRVQRLRTPNTRTSTLCLIMPGLNTLASASRAHGVHLRTPVRVVWQNTLDTSTRKQPGIGVRLAGKASPFARTISVILQPIRVSNDMFVPCAWMNLHGRAIWKLTCCNSILPKSHLSNLFAFVVDVKQTEQLWCFVQQYCHDHIQAPVLIDWQHDIKRVCTLLVTRGGPCQHGLLCGCKALRTWTDRPRGATSWRVFAADLLVCGPRIFFALR